MKVPVLFPKIFDYPFTYKSELSHQLNPGDFVKAPFGSSEITGVVWTYEQKTDKKNRYLKFIPYTWQLLESRMKGEIFLELKKILDRNISKKIRRKVVFE